MGEEATITIGGCTLTPAQSMAVRVAVASMLADLADPEERKALGPISEKYRARLSEVEGLILGGIGAQPPGARGITDRSM